MFSTRNGNRKLCQVWYIEINLTDIVNRTLNIKQLNMLLNSLTNTVWNLLIFFYLTFDSCCNYVVGYRGLLVHRNVTTHYLSQVVFLYKTFLEFLPKATNLRYLRAFACKNVLVVLIIFFQYDRNVLIKLHSNYYVINLIINCKAFHKVGHILGNV